MPEKKAPAAPMTRSSVPPPPIGPEPVPASPTATDGLPLRRRKRPMAIVPGSAPAALASARSGAQTAEIMGAFQRGTRSGRAARGDEADQTSSTRGSSSEGHEFS